MLERPYVGDERSAREVLFTLLLVVFVIVLTALVATVVLDMGQDPSGEGLASVSIAFDADTDAIHVTFTSMVRPGTTLEVTVQNASTDRTIASTRLSSVGQRHTLTDFDDGALYRVVVIAEWRDSRSVVTIRTGRL